MDNGSEFVWLNVDEAEVAEVEVDKVTDDLWEQDDIFQKAYVSAVPPPQQAPPPPPVPTTEAPLPKPALKKRVVKKADTNVISVNFGTLETGVTLSTGDAIFCQQCKSVLSHMSPLKSRQESEQNSNNNGNSGHIWTCEFCGTQNDVNCDEAEIPKEESLDYILEAPSETSKSTLDEGLVIFCLDISGSMGITYEVQGKFQLKGHEKTSKLASLNQERNQYGQYADQFLPNERRDITYVTRLQCVQAAVSTEFERMSKENPNKRVCMLTFNHEVNILGDGSSETVVVAGDKLFNYNQLFEIGTNYYESLKNPISQTVSKLNDKVWGIEETGATALGPALVVALGLASKSQGSKIVICTDGLTNTGLGSLDELYTDSDKELVATFYENIGLYSKAQGIVISVLSIKGQDCNLENLGRLSDLTAGQVDRVDPLEINKNFQSILSLPVLATNVHAVLMLHRGLRFKQENEDDLFAVKPENNSNEPLNENCLTRFIGNVTKETEVTFEYGVKPNLKKEDFVGLDHLPFQLQIKYTRIDGMKCMRVISKKTAITFNRQVAEEKANIAVLGTNAVQQTAKIAAKGDYSGARFYNMANKAMFNRAAKSEQQKQEFSAWSKHGRKLESALVEAQQTEVKQGLFLDDAMDQEFISERVVLNDHDEQLSQDNQHKFENFTFTTKPSSSTAPSKPSSSSKQKEAIRKNQRNDETSHMLYNMKSMNKSNMK